MPIGSSGCIVIEIDPDLKQALHQSLRQHDSNLKEWFVQRADHFLRATQEALEMPYINQQVERKEHTG